MKLGKLLLPFALFVAAPLCACTPVVPKGNDIDDDDDGDVVLTLEEVIDKVEETFDVELTYDDSDEVYWAEVETSDSLEDAVKAAAEAVDFLEVIDEPQTEEDYFGDETWYAYFENSDGSVALYIYSLVDGDNYIGYSVYSTDETGGGEGEQGETTTSWAEIHVDDYFDCSVTIPGPDGASEFEYYCEDEYVEVYAYGASAEAYATKLENADFYVDDSYLEDYGYYFADSPDETVTIMFYDNDQYGSLDISISSYME